MGNSKEFNLFLASSVVEFKEMREKLSAFFNGPRVRKVMGANISLTRCEDVSTKMAVDGKQNEYNEIIRKSDIFIVLVGKHLVKQLQQNMQIKLSFPQLKLKKC